MLTLRNSISSLYPHKTVRREHEKFNPHQDQKVTLETADGYFIEAALFGIFKNGLLQYHACISSQVGCARACTFCASGRDGLIRNLQFHEIIEQVSKLLGIINRSYLDDLVFMGVGEPLDNLEAVSESISEIRNLGYVCGKIRVATCGIPHKIREFTSLQIPDELWISLHASSDHKRAYLMPVAKHWSISEVLSAGEEYANATNTQVTLNYIVLHDYNDFRSDADSLCALVEGKTDLFRIQLVEPNGQLRNQYRTCIDDLNRFQSMISRNCSVEVKLLLSKGIAVEAGCGELRIEANNMRIANLCR